MTYESPNVDGLLIAQMRTICEQLIVNLDLPEQIDARQRLEYLLRAFAPERVHPGWFHRPKPQLRIVTPDGGTKEPEAA